MQFIEVNSFEVRSAVHRLERRGEPLRFVLFPMIHVGERSYYEDIAARASRCDLLLVEGVPSIWARIAIERSCSACSRYSTSRAERR